jgi:hypothetical protein
VQIAAAAADTVKTVAAAAAAADTVKTAAAADTVKTAAAAAAALITGDPTHQQPEHSTQTALAADCRNALSVIEEECNVNVTHVQADMYIPTMR